MRAPILKMQQVKPKKKNRASIEERLSRLEEEVASAKEKVEEMTWVLREVAAMILEVIAKDRKPAGEEPVARIPKYRR